MKKGKDALIVAGSVVVLVTLFFVIFLRPKNGPQFEVIKAPSTDLDQVGTEQGSVTSNSQNYDVTYGDISDAQKSAADLAVSSLNPTQPVNVVSVTAEEFSDSSLGCPKEGEVYSQVVTPGYTVILQVEEQTYDYRVTTEGDIISECLD
jgi:hypothetical protein